MVSASFDWSIVCVCVYIYIYILDLISYNRFYLSNVWGSYPALIPHPRAPPPHEQRRQKRSNGACEPNILGICISLSFPSIPASCASLNVLLGLCRGCGRLFSSYC
jgi:hypothetical protein